MASSSEQDTIPQWLKSLPLAPEFHPTLEEFQDPISYILKIEKEASSFGICKIIPPLPPPPKKTTISNLNRSFSAKSPSSSSPTFATRQQQIGFCPRRPRPVQKPVWQSGQSYTLSQFEAKANQFERSHFKKLGFSPRRSGKAASALEIESLFWKASTDRPFSVEYANDIPGTGFAPAPNITAAAKNVGESAWNMRVVSRAKGSLLRFMREDIAGVTSPMVYVAMMFSWFAWHAEDHELHSLNYLHMGEGKTWYGVPRDAALAFEEVVRVQGYNNEVNPLVTFTILGEKTTVMSPEVFVGAGIPCCRLVQNAGEFVITFPGAYHSGFSHGFNCGEASNIATPEWLNVAKEAAIRRASTNYPPMVSHFQLLFTLALSLCSRIPMTVGYTPRSSRIKDKMRSEAEVMIKDIFVRNIIETNDLLSTLQNKGSHCTVLPQNASGSPLCSNLHGRSYLKIKPRLSLGLCSREEAMEASRLLPSEDVMLESSRGLTTFSSLNGFSLSAPQGRPVSESCLVSGTGADNFLSSKSLHLENENQTTVHGDGLLDHGLLPCVTCGILSFTCVAVVHPREAAARYLMAADYGFLNDRDVDFGEFSCDGAYTRGNTDDQVSGSCQIKNQHQETEVDYNDVAHSGVSALALLASAYGDSSDSEEERQLSISTDNKSSNHQHRLSPKYLLGGAQFNDESNQLKSYTEDVSKMKLEFSHDKHPVNANYDLSMFNSDEVMKSDHSIKSMGEHVDIEFKVVESCHTSGNISIQQREMNLRSMECRSTSRLIRPDVYCSPAASSVKSAKDMHPVTFEALSSTSTISGDKPDKDSSRMHVFCLEHAMEVEKLLHPIGGANITLLCHPDYPKIEEEAKSLSKQLGTDYIWKDIEFMEATQEDQENIHMTLEDEEFIPTNSDWAVKMGINLYYSANLSKSPLYSKQMPYNTVIYKVFGCNLGTNNPIKPRPNRRKPYRQKKIVVAGKWCGKVWMSNQVHPYLAVRKDAQERQLSENLLTQEVETERDNRLAQAKNLCKDVSVDRKSGKKRKKKKPSSVPRSKKCKIQELEDTSTNSGDVEISPAQCGMVLRSCRKTKFKDEDEDRPKASLRRLLLSEAEHTKKEIPKKNVKKAKSSAGSMLNSDEAEYTCDIEGCSMSFRTKHDLTLHKKDICPEKGCGKKFFSHKYLVQHRKVHMDDRPLECPWNGCDMRFKWAWARTEHIRVHTGDRPYVCSECTQTFRFVSDFSRHKRKTGHQVKKVRR